MNFQEFSDQLALAGDRPLLLRLPSGTHVPDHFHVTEVGKLSKDFVDCGGVRRTEQTCVLQTLVREDFEHRLRANKLSRILALTSQLDLADETPVEFEIQGNTIETYSLSQCQLGDTHLTLMLTAKQTACLAPDACGLGGELPTLQPSCCSDTGCC